MLRLPCCTIHESCSQFACYNFYTLSFTAVSKLSLIWCKLIFLVFVTLCNNSSFLIRSVQMVLSIILQPHISNFPGISDLLSNMSNIQHHTKLCFKCSTLLLSIKYNFLVKVFFFLFNAAFSVEILDLILRVHLASFVIMIRKYLKYYTFFSCFLYIAISIGDCSIEILITSPPPSHPFLFHRTTIRITVLPALESLNPPRASLVSYSLLHLNTISDNQNPCPSPVPVVTLLLFPWSNHTYHSDPRKIF
jgi:hypothetical protein